MQQALIPLSDSCFGATNHTMTRCCSSDVKVCRHHLYCATILLWCHNGRKTFFGFPNGYYQRLVRCAYLVPFPCGKWVSELHQTACLKHVILASRGMLTASRETVSIPICFSTLTAHHQSNNKTLSSFINTQCGLSQHIVNAHHLYVCAWHCLQLPTLCTCVFLCSYLQLLAVKEKKRVMAPNALHAVSDWDVCGVMCTLIHFLEVQLGSNDLKEVLWITLSSSKEYLKDVCKLCILVISLHIGWSFVKKITLHQTKAATNLGTHCVTFHCLCCVLP